MIKFKKGDTYQILYMMGPGKPYKIHILEIVDGDYIVFKWYGRHKQWWHYDIKHRNTLEIYIKKTKEKTK